MLIFPGKFSKLSIGVPKKPWGGQKGRKEDSLQYERYSTYRYFMIFWSWKPAHGARDQEMHVLWYFFSTFFRWAHVWAGMGKVGKMGIRPISTDTQKRHLWWKPEKWRIMVNFMALGPANRIKKKYAKSTEANVHFTRLGEKFVSLLGGHFDGVLKQWWRRGWCWCWVCVPVRLL